MLRAAISASLTLTPWRRCWRRVSQRTVSPVCVVVAAINSTIANRLVRGRPRQFLRDVTEQAMLYFVPFRRAGRIVANANRQPRFVGEFLQFDFPQAHTRAIGPATVAVIIKRSRVGYRSRPIVSCSGEWC